MNFGMFLGGGVVLFCRESGTKKLKKANLVVEVDSINETMQSTNSGGHSAMRNEQ
jgi:hypothetical protein